MVALAFEASLGGKAFVVDLSMEATCVSFSWLSVVVLLSSDSVGVIFVTALPASMDGMIVYLSFSSVSATGTTLFLSLFSTLVDFGSFLATILGVDSLSVELFFLSESSIESVGLTTTGGTISEAAGGAELSLSQGIHGVFVVVAFVLTTAGVF